LLILGCKENLPQRPKSKRSSKEEKTSLMKKPRMSAMKRESRGRMKLIQEPGVLE